MFGYPTLPMNGTIQHRPGSIHGGTGTLPPVPLPRLNFQVSFVYLGVKKYVGEIKG